MDKAARVRWAFLLAMLTATVIAIVFPDSSDATVEAAVPAVARRPAVAAAASPATEASEREVWIATTEDLFASRDWQAAPAPVEPVARAVQTVEAIEAAPPPPPPLPYKFVGQMSDDGDRVVYLSRGEQVLLARTGTILDGTYKVAQIGPSNIEFQTLTSGLQQSLPIPAQERQ